MLPSVWGIKEQKGEQGWGDKSASGLGTQACQNVQGGRLLASREWGLNEPQGNQGQVELILIHFNNHIQWGGYPAESHAGTSISPGGKGKASGQLNARHCFGVNRGDIEFLLMMARNILCILVRPQRSPSFLDANHLEYLHIFFELWLRSTQSGYLSKTRIFLTLNIRKIIELIKLKWAHILGLELCIQVTI